ARRGMFGIARADAADQVRTVEAREAVAVAPRDVARTLARILPAADPGRAALEPERRHRERRVQIERLAETLQRIPVLASPVRCLPGEIVPQRRERRTGERTHLRGVV